MTKRQFFRSIVACCFSLVVPYSAALSAADPVRLKGTVTRKNGAPLGNARIEFDPGEYVAISDRNGRFIIRNFIPSEYNVTVREGGKYQIFGNMKISDTLELRVEW
jgi:hypothetical protein